MKVKVGEVVVKFVVVGLKAEVVVVVARVVVVVVVVVKMEGVLVFCSGGEGGQGGGGSGDGEGGGGSGGGSGGGGGGVRGRRFLVSSDIFTNKPFSTGRRTGAGRRGLWTAGESLMRHYRCTLRRRG